MCEFYENKAESKPKEANDIFFGGAAVFLTVRNGNIKDCKFVKNSPNGVKMYNNFDIQRSIKESKTNILFENCLFVIDQKSNSSFYYICGSKYEIPVEIKDCIFIGNLASNAHHIDGHFLGKNLKNSKLQIKSCKFNSNSDTALNMKSKELELMFASFKMNSQEFEIKETKKDQPNSSIRKINYSSPILVISFAIVVVAGISSFVKNKNERNEKKDEIEVA